MERNIMFPRSIRYLMAVAEHGSFTRAAQALYVSQPTLSQQIKQLEEALDVELLDRSERTVRLTEAGNIYLHHAKKALGELDAGQRAIHDLQDLNSGLLTIGMTPVTDFLTAPLLDHFNARHPGIVIETLEMSQEELEAGIADDRLDLGIAFSNSLSGGSRANDIEPRVLFIETLNLSVGVSHPCAGYREPLTAKGLEQEPLVLLNADFALRRLFDIHCLEHEIRPNVAIETDSLSAIVEIVRLGRLGTVLPGSIARTQHDLRLVSLTPEMPHHAVTLVCRKGAYKSPACRAFMDLATYACIGANDQPEQHPQFWPGRLFDASDIG
jgi:LysR family cyn operon transcriptional activator